MKRFFTDFENVKWLVIKAARKSQPCFHTKRRKLYDFSFNREKVFLFFFKALIFFATLRLCVRQAFKNQPIFVHFVSSW
ncbi:MAG: hypothetical protein C0615_10950 [Desulfuromonas sp.]|nr:MAG: hypothetical protein C0615_10950 [Desulfuromonas sp.]